MELNHLEHVSASLRSHLHNELVEPAVEFLSRSSKGIRKQLVSAGFTWVAQKSASENELQLCQEVGVALELVHAASLIIDDIQDNSSFRRGREAVHILIGTGKAINVANWIYFKALDQVDQLSVADNKRLRLQSLFRAALLQGHAGQALDLGIPIRQMPRESVAEVCQTSIRLKTGALTALAFASGAVIADIKESDLVQAQSIGEEIGVILQSLDDLKNLKVDPLASGKRYEDLQNQRPSLIWLMAAKHPHPNCWNDLQLAVEALPSPKPVEDWLMHYEISNQAQVWIDQRISELKQTTQLPLEINEIINQLVNAYEKL